VTSAVLLVVDDCGCPSTTLGMTRGAMVLLRWDVRDG
jgi:hypothetical protein